jgi:hypothetical protein
MTAYSTADTEAGGGSSGFMNWPLENREGDLFPFIVGSEFSEILKHVPKKT